MNDLVSIIMLSRNRAQFVEESVKSVLAQTYTNWELLFVDDNSKDGTITKMMELKDAMGRDLARKMRILQTVNTRGTTRNRNEALKVAKGRWIAFLDAGDVWMPDKLEKQIAFMEENGYAFSYTSYGLMDMESRNRGVVVSGKAHVTHGDMLKCCWPAYMTGMYDREKVGEMKVRAPLNNDYALWLNVSDRHDCYLLDENLATMRTKWGRLGRILLTNNIKWRYDAYRIDEDLGPFTSLLYTIRNGWYGIVKWFRYAKTA
jgi:glycosyltransferase involved in cell wall biosynthesis